MYLRGRDYTLSTHLFVSTISQLGVWWLKIPGFPKALIRDIHNGVFSVTNPNYLQILA
jgi:hypothetical protein